MTALLRSWRGPRRPRDRHRADGRRRRTARSGSAQIKGRRLAVAQQPSEAEAAGMPRTAIEAGVVDLALPLRDIPAAIARYCGAAPRLSTVNGERRRAAVVALLAVLEEHAQPRFRRVLAVASSIRRVGRRMRMHAIDDWSEYLGCCAPTRPRPSALVGDVLRMSRSSSREPVRAARDGRVAALFALKHGDRDSVARLDRRLLDGRRARTRLRSRCSSERAPRVRPRIQVFASDFAEDSLQRARLGRYPAAIAGLMSAEALAEVASSVRSSAIACEPELRNLVVFAAATTSSTTFRFRSSISSFAAAAC